MFQYSIRFFKRFVVLIPGVIIAYISVEKIFPYFDSRLPLSIAILATYILGAYVLIPAIIRVVRAIKPTDHLPLYCVTPDGFASDPLNIGIISTRLQLIQAMESTGWFVADQHTPKNMLHSVVSTIFSRYYPHAPVSSLYLFGRKQDIAFEIPIDGTLGGRHHVRFWATTYKSKEKLSVKSIQWHRRKSHVQGKNLLWVGASSLDSGIAFIRHNFQVSHMIHPDTDAERSLIVDQLRAKKLIASQEQIVLGKPYRLANRVWRGDLKTDGRMIIVKLKKA
jgi:hypothetical protein